MNGYMYISLTAVDKTTFPVAITAFLVHFVTAWMLRENFTNKNNGLWKWSQRGLKFVAKRLLAKKIGQLKQINPKALQFHSSHQYRDLFEGFGNIIEWEREVLTYAFNLSLIWLPHSWDPENQDATSTSLFWILKCLSMSFLF